MITIKSGAVTLVTAWLYYRSFWMLLPLLPVWAWHFKMMAEEVARKKDQEFLLQFKEAIQAMASALNTGYSVENALLEAQKELRLLYPEDARISREFLVMARQLRLHVPMEQILEEFAGRSGQDCLISCYVVMKYGLWKRMREAFPHCIHWLILWMRLVPVSVRTKAMRRII